jgi:hypothetical protein
MDERVAETTLQWLDNDKLSFLWNNELVLVHYDREYHFYRILTDHDEETLTAINNWLHGLKQRIENENQSSPDQTDRN